MFKRSTVIVALSALLLGLGALPAAGAPSDPFSGQWTSVDHDGSNQQLTFRGQGETRQVRLFDDDATGACELGGPARLDGTGEISADGSTIHVSFETLRCMRGDPAFEPPVAVDFIHDADTNTLTDNTGVVWTRRPQRAPRSSVFTGEWTSVDVDGSNQTLTFRGNRHTLRVELFDDDATLGCTEGGPAELSGTGAVSADGSTVHVTIRTMVCEQGEPNPDLEFPIEVDFKHDPANDTLSDGGVTWFRPGVAPPEPFLGAWVAVDVDGSDMTLSFAVPLDGAEGERTVTLYDDNATGGVCLDGEGRAIGSGIGVIDGDTITGAYDGLECLDGDSLEITELDFEFVHDPVTDTLDGFWHRP